MKRLIFSLFYAATTLTCSQATQAQAPPLIHWDKSFGGQQQDYITSLKQTNDGGYIIGGNSHSGSSGNKSENAFGREDYWIVKLNNKGVKQWDRTFGGNSDDKLTSIIQTIDGGYLIGGYSASGISGNKSDALKGVADYWIIKVDSEGQIQWDKTFGGLGWDYLTDLKQTVDGGYVIAGYSDSGISGDKSEAHRGLLDYWVLKLDWDGNKIWDKTIGGTDTDELTQIEETADGGFLLGGHSLSGISMDKTQPSRGSTDFWVVKLDKTGNKQWDKTIGGNNNDYLTALQITSDGGFVVGGSSDSHVFKEKTQPSKGLFDYLLVKFNKMGIKEWDKTLGGNKLDLFYSLIQTSDKGYLLVGYSESGKSGDKTESNKGGSNDIDGWIVKVDSLGNKEWDKTIGGSKIDNLVSIDFTADGGYILGGSSTSGISGDKSEGSYGDSDFWVLKLGYGEKPTEEPVVTRSIPYPNPAPGMVYINLEETQSTEVKVFNTKGICVHDKTYRQTNQDGKIAIDLSMEAKGVYIVQIHTGSQITTKKVVLQ